MNMNMRIQMLPQGVGLERSDTVFISIASDGCMNRLDFVLSKNVTKKKLKKNCR